MGGGGGTSTQLSPGPAWVSDTTCGCDDIPQHCSNTCWIKARRSKQSLCIGKLDGIHGVHFLRVRITVLLVYQCSNPGWMPVHLWKTYLPYLAGMGFFFVVVSNKVAADSAEMLPRPVTFVLATVGATVGGSTPAVLSRIFEHADFIFFFQKKFQTLH